MDITTGLKKVVEGIDLSEEEAKACMDSIMEGDATDAQIGGFLTALRMKGETIEEITGCARTMREKVAKVELSSIENVIDTCGTGGDSSGTINISTISAIVAAGAGIKVAKHGNRSVSSQCGSADVLEALGVNIALTPDQVAACIEQAGIGFMFAPGFHAAMKYAIGPRKEMKIRTIFNILGPLTNPAGVERQVLGVFSRKLVDPLAHVLAKLGAREAMIVHGEGGLDEFSIAGVSTVGHVKDGGVISEEVSPEDVGLSSAALSEIQATDLESNKSAALGIISGDISGPMRDVVLLNGGACIAVGGGAENLKDGVTRAAEAIDSGKAKTALDTLIEVSNSF